MTRAGLLVHQTAIEQRAFWRNPDAAFFTFALPIILLVVIGSTNDGEADPAYLVPGIIAFGLIAATYSNLAARIAGLRADGALKRIRTTPLPPMIYLSGHVVSAVLTALLIAALLVLVGYLVFSVVPHAGGLLALACGIVVGIVCFASLALAVTGLIPSAEAASPVTNGTFLPLALVSGLFHRSLSMPDWVDRVVAYLPIKPLAGILELAYETNAGGFPVRELVVLGVWALFGMATARRFFRWQP